MKCCDMTSNMLSRQITIEQRVQSPDGMGGFAESWAPLAIAWASVKPTSGRERAYADRIEAQVDFKAVVRFVGDENNNPLYTASHLVQFQGLTYGLEYVIDMEGQRTWLELGMRAAK